jgi:hypothetical protein
MAQQHMGLNELGERLAPLWRFGIGRKPRGQHDVRNARNGAGKRVVHGFIVAAVVEKNIDGDRPWRTGLNTINQLGDFVSRPWPGPELGEAVVIDGDDRRRTRRGDGAGQAQRVIVCRGIQLRKIRRPGRQQQHRQSHAHTGGCHRKQVLHVERNYIVIAVASGTRTAR